uniref:Insc_C domain-containing protein n=1 Tax=Strongyloides papillosus TaxID=174720 RepID=A0A0N5BZF7_STREA
MNMKNDETFATLSNQLTFSKGFENNDLYEIEHFTLSDEINNSTKRYLVDLSENCEMDIQYVLFSRSCFDIDNKDVTDNFLHYPDFQLLDRKNKPKKCIARLTSSLQTVVSTSSTEINVIENAEKYYDNYGKSNASEMGNNNFCDNNKTINNEQIFLNNGKFCYTSNFENGSVAILYTSRNNISYDGRISNGKRLFISETNEKKYKKDVRPSQKGYYLKLRGSTPNLSGIVEEDDVEDVDRTPFIRSYDNCSNLKNYKNIARKPVIRARINSTSSINKKIKHYAEGISKPYNNLIHVNNIDSQPLTNNTSISLNNGENIVVESYTSSSSPKSIYSTRSSTDSGQESTGTDCHLQKNFNKISLYHYIIKYQQIYTIIDNILKLGSNIYSSLTYIIDNKFICRNLLIESSQLITLLKNRYLYNTVNYEDINLIQELLMDVEKEVYENGENRIFSNYFIIILRRTIEETFHTFAKIIFEYFVTSNNNDELLHIGTEHFIYLLLFSDELCNVAMQYNLVKKLLQHCTNPTTNYHTIKLLLRALAVLCSTSKGCTQLLENDGFNFIINVICNYPFDCSVEAAGVLTQLTSPPSNCMTLLKSISPIITKLTEMIECCDSSESLLLCTAALSNLSIQYPSANRYINEIKTCQKLVLATKKPKCCSIFVYEQLVTLMARMVSQGWYLTLYNKECVDILLHLMLINDEYHLKYCERIKYKSAVALSSIAKNDYGLHLIKINNGYGIMCKITESNLNNTQDPMVVICQTIRDRLENFFDGPKALETEL